MKYNFNEKQEEYSAKQGKNIPVWVNPKFLETKEEVTKLLDSKKYDLTANDFWILMNETKSGKMGYTSLIISHNGCLKINEKLERKFKPSCVTVDKDGYNNSLVYSYSNDDQEIYEVGEVSLKNCKNDYPYAMAFKRCFDRVVLKLSKLAFYGVYSDSEADEFADKQDEKETQVILKPRATAEQIAKIKELVAEEDMELLLNYFKISKLEDLSEEDAAKTITRKSS